MKPRHGATLAMKLGDKIIFMNVLEQLLQDGDKVTFKNGVVGTVSTVRGTKRIYTGQFNTSGAELFAYAYNYKGYEYLVDEWNIVSIEHAKSEPSTKVEQELAEAVTKRVLTDCVEFTESGKFAQIQSGKFGYISPEHANRLRNATFVDSSNEPCEYKHILRSLLREGDRVIFANGETAYCSIVGDDVRLVLPGHSDMRKSLSVNDYNGLDYKDFVYNVYRIERELSNGAKLLIRIEW